MIRPTKQQHCSYLCDFTFCSLMFNMHVAAGQSQLHVNLMEQLLRRAQRASGPIAPLLHCRNMCAQRQGPVHNFDHPQNRQIFAAAGGKQGRLYLAESAKTNLISLQSIQHRVHAYSQAIVPCEIRSLVRPYMQQSIQQPLMYKLLLVQHIAALSAHIGAMQLWLYVEPGIMLGRKILLQGCLRSNL